MDVVDLEVDPGRGHPRRRPAEFGSPDPRDVQSRAAVVTTGAGGTHVPPWDAPGRAPVCAVNSASWLRNELVCALHSRTSRSSCSTLAS